MAFIVNAEQHFQEGRDPMQSLLIWMEGYWHWLRSPVFPAMHRFISSELRNYPELAEFYGKEVFERAQRLLHGMLERGMESGLFRRMDPQVAARIMVSMFVTHGIWYHQPDGLKSISGIPDDVLLTQLREFFLNAMRPDADTTPHA